MDTLERLIGKQKLAYESQNESQTNQASQDDLKQNVISLNQVLADGTKLPMNQATPH